MSSMSERNPTSPQDLLHYVPRRLRETEGVRLSVVEDTSDADQPAERSNRAVMPGPSHLDSRLENAVFQSLRHSLDPQVMQEPPELNRERDRRSVVLKIVARFAAAVGVAAVVALFFVNIVPASRKADAGSSFVSAVQSMKASAPAPAATAETTGVKAGQAAAKPDDTNVKAIPALSAFQSLLASSGDASQSPPKTEATSDKPLLQQFMQWNDKAAQSDKGQ